MSAGRTLAGLPRSVAELAFALIFLLAPIGAHTAYAQAALDPAALDVAGVKLGMTLGEAPGGLKDFDPRL